MLPSVAELIAYHLRSNGYTETLTNFVREAALPSNVGTCTDGQVTIESILKEKQNFDRSINCEKSSIDHEHRGWTERAPVKPTVINSLPNRSNILSINVLSLSLSTAIGTRPYIAVTTANRQLHLLDPDAPNFVLAKTYSSFQDAPSLDVVSVDSRFLLVASMSGKLTVVNVMTGESVDQRQDHTKYLVKIAVWSEGNSTIVASAGWDAKIFFYRFHVAENTPRLLRFADLALASIPETILFLQSPENTNPILLVTRRDSTFLHYYSVDTSEPGNVVLLGQQNLAPHSNAWIAFTPADVQVCPTNPQILAVATASTPHMRLLVVKLLLPPSRLPSSKHDIGPELDIVEPGTQVPQERASMLVADREERAILVNASTLAPQTAYSTPRIIWRPDGSGVYVSSDDGIVRGIETKSGKLVLSQKGHEPGSKIRCLWAGLITKNDVNAQGVAEPIECLISGGFDQKLIVWQVPSV